MRRETRIAGAAFIAVPAAIVLFTLVSTFAISRDLEGLRVLFRAMCHGLATRCLTLFGVPMPLCARCTGIYLGLIAGLAAFFVVPKVKEKVMRVVAIVAAMPMAVDGITQALGLRESTNPLRLATGIAAAFAFGMWALSAVEHGEPQSFTNS